MFFMPGCVVGVAFLLVTFSLAKQRKVTRLQGEKQSGSVLQKIQQTDRNSRTDSTKPS
jgi:hypothetical protein